MIETDKPLERAILIGILYPGQDESEVDDFLDELAFLDRNSRSRTIKKIYPEA